MVKIIKMKISNTLSHAHSYEQYMEIMTQLSNEKDTSGSTKSEALIKYSSLNYSRMKRLNKGTFSFDKSLFPMLNEDIVMLCLTESWCGDAAQNLPILHQMTDLDPHLSLKLIWRDEHMELMEKYKTNGALSIPKILFVNSKNEIMNSWGPRPSELQAWVMDAKYQRNVDYSEISLYVQKWYNKDKGQSTFSEIAAILSEIK